MVKKIAVIGSNGFLGKSLVSLLLNEGYFVIAVYNKSQYDWKNENVQSLSWTAFLDAQLNLDAIIYTASIIPYGHMDDYNDEMLLVNAINNFAIRKVYPKVHFIYISSVSVYAISKGAITENSPVLPQGAYAESKLAGELVAKGFNRSAVVRCSSIFGSGMNQSTFIPRCISQAKDDGVITLYGEGTRLQNYIHVDDVSAMCLAIIQQEKVGVFLSVAPRSFSNMEIAETLAAYYNAKINHVGTDCSPSYIYDAQFTYGALGYTPRGVVLTDIYD